MDREHIALPGVATPGSEVVLGLGGCIDYEMHWDAQVLQRLVDQYHVRRPELDRSVAVDSERNLVRSLVSHLADGAGGEAYVASNAIVRDFADRFDYRETLGGTNVRAAIAMARVGVPSTLHLVSVDGSFRTLLPPQVSWVCSATQDSTDPHLIVQYPEGAAVRLADGELLVAPSSNRLIYVNDVPNGLMVLSSDFPAMVSGARVVLISGLNAVRDQTILDTRLAEIAAALRTVPAGTVVMCEDAAYHAAGQGQRVLRALAGQLGVFGMNEDEMQTRLGRPVNLLDAAAVHEAVDHLRRAIPVPTLLIHTRFWALAAGATAGEHRAGLEYGVAMSAARYLHGDDFTEAEIAALAGHPRHPGGVVVAEQLHQLAGSEFVCIPAFSLSPPSPTTVGLGDAFVGGFLAGTLTGRREPVSQRLTAIVATPQGMDHCLQDPECL